MAIAVAYNGEVNAGNAAVTARLLNGHIRTAALQTNDISNVHAALL